MGVRNLKDNTSETDNDWLLNQLDATFDDEELTEAEREEMEMIEEMWQIDWERIIFNSFTVNGNHPTSWEEFENFTETTIFNNNIIVSEFQWNHIMEILNQPIDADPTTTAAIMLFGIATYLGVTQHL